MAAKIVFDEMANQLLEVSAYISPSEVQGLLTGLSCSGMRLSQKQLEHVMKEHFELDSLPPPLSLLIEALVKETLESMASVEHLYELMLPDDDDGLVAQTEAMGLWCQGFLVGFGTVTKKNSEQDYSEEVQSALQDVVDISNLEPACDDDAETQKAFFEISEYLRVAVMLIFMELSAGEPAKSASTPVLH